MASVGSLERLINRWRDDGAEPRPPATPAELAAFEMRYGVKLPQDFCQYLLLADGMKDGDCDNDMISFWQLSRVRPITEELPEPIYETYRRFSEAKHCFCFADWSLNATVFCIHLSSDNSSPVRFSRLGPEFLPIKTFADFVEVSLTDAKKLVGPLPA